MIGRDVRRKAWRVVLLLAIAGCGWLGLLAATTPSIKGLDQYRPPGKSIFYASDGSVLATLYTKNREWAPLETIPAALQQATIAIEDQRFYRHNGVDPQAILRAIWHDLRSLRIQEGGSTITQQLARTLYLHRRRTLSRKLQEMILARRIERLLTKQKILELYLNEIYYGAGAYGVRVAAKRYFGKQLDSLTLAEAALLAGLPSRPNALSPFEDQEAAIHRRDVVLRRMVAEGQITPAQAAAAAREPLHLAKAHGGRRVKRAPYFVDWLVRQLVERFGEAVVYDGGLQVHTTLNLDLQRAAEAALRAGLHGKQQGAVAALDPATGDVKAMVGGRDYRQSVYNRAVNALGRQPGSAFKPILYAAALEQGYTPETVLKDTPLAVRANDSIWRPKNYDGRFRGTVTLYDALIYSINVPAVRVALAIDPALVAAMALRLGIDTPMPAVPSLALGSAEVTPLALTAAYAAFDNGGHRVSPGGIVRVTDSSGNVLWKSRSEAEQALPVEVAKTMAMLLRDAVLYGTGRAVAATPNAAGKTGTTQENRDAWFVGFTPALVAGVWVGNDDHTPMGAVYGGSAAAPIWARFMDQALPHLARGGSGAAVIPSYRQVIAARLAEQRRLEAQEKREEEAWQRAAHAIVPDLPLPETPSNHIPPVPEPEAPSLPAIKPNASKPEAPPPPPAVNIPADKSESEPLPPAANPSGNTPELEPVAPDTPSLNNAPEHIPLPPDATTPNNKPENAPPPADPNAPENIPEAPPYPLPEGTPE